MKLSTKRLRSVVHSIAHHSVSGLCFIHPHIGQACMELGLDRATFSLIDEESKSSFEKSSKHIQGGADTLRQQFLKILQSEKLSLEDLSEATATFFFTKGTWPSGCYVKTVSVSGRTIEVAVNGVGNLAEIVK